MKKRIFTLLSVALVLTLATTAALAWGPGFGRGGGGAASCLNAIPNLTAEQSAQIQALRDGFLKETEPLRKELYAKRSEMRNVRRSANPDQAALTAQQQELINLRTQLRDKAAAHRTAMRNVLTPEQLAQMPACPQGVEGAPGAGFGPGPGAGFGPRGGMRGPGGRW